MTINLADQDERHHRNAHALCALLAQADLPEICTWTLGEDGIQGQLSSVYRDQEASDRIHALAAHLDAARVVTQPGHYRGCAYTTVEALGTVDGVTVRFWTHTDHRPEHAEEPQS